MITAGSGATVAGNKRSATTGTVTIPGKKDAIPHFVTGSPAAGGYVPLNSFGTTPIAGTGDETITNLNTPAFIFGGATYTQIGVDANGVLAPYWTDLTAHAAGTSDGLAIEVENLSGTSGSSFPGPPNADVGVQSTPEVVRQKKYTLTVKGTAAGNPVVQTSLNVDGRNGPANVNQTITVSKPK